MRKILFSVATIFATNSIFGQINLVHSFEPNERVTAYSKGETFYLSFKEDDNKLKIYNVDFSLRKTVNIPMPANYNRIWANGEGEYSISKHIFNTDDKYEFLVTVSYTDANNKYFYKLLLINEDGQLIKDFNPNAGTINYRGYSEIFHDIPNNQNKFIVNSANAENYNELFDVYSLPTSELTNKEIKSLKLSAFPNPANKVLNIVNPKNGANKIEIFDTSGKLVINRSFANSESKISVDVESLPKGIYVYKVGNLSSKFIKN
ncbi:MAG: T9SS type A sorting domain-containing protein [Myroides sp.]|nr:T9SS type A sorting domain-containing protein [Myroides sp.]